MSLSLNIGLALRSQGAWTPLSLPGLWTYLPGTIQGQTEGGNVGLWTDASTNGNNATAIAAAPYRLGQQGGAAIGSLDYQSNKLYSLTALGTVDSFYVVAVAQRKNFTNSAWYVWSANDDAVANYAVLGWWDRRPGNTNFVGWFGEVATPGGGLKLITVPANADYAVLDDAPHVLELSYDGTQKKLWFSVDGARQSIDADLGSVPLADKQTIGGLRYGATTSSQWAGFLGDVIIGKGHALTDSDVAQVVAYIQTKRGGPYTSARRTATVYTPGTGTVWIPNILKFGSTYYAFFSAFPTGALESNPSKIYVSTSADKVTWGAATELDAGTASPDATLLHHGGAGVVAGKIVRLLKYGWNSLDDHTQFRSSTDGSTWVAAAEIPDVAGYGRANNGLCAYHASPVLLSGKLLFPMTGVPSGGHFESVLVGYDGTTWSLVGKPANPAAGEITEWHCVLVGGTTLLGAFRCDGDGYTYTSTSTDGGATWSALSKRTEFGTTTGGWGFNHLAAVPGGPILWSARGKTIWASWDSGVTWHATNLNAYGSPQSIDCMIDGPEVVWLSDMGTDSIGIMRDTAGAWV